MAKNLLKKIVADIEGNFSIFTEYLLAPIHTREFKLFLANYRGMQDKLSDHPFEMQQLSEKTAGNIVDFFVNIFAKNGLAEETTENIAIILNEVEKIVNLTLYYWFGLNDRNYQFRAVVHFFQIEGLGSIFLTKNKIDYAVSISENGLRFGKSDSAHEVKCLPVSKVCELNHFTVNTEQRKLFARIRTIQREICLLVDEWEHLNAILAVEYSQIYYELQQNQSQKAVNAFEDISAKMNLRRDTLATWCLESFCDFQEWISEILIENKTLGILCEDILAELDATAAVLLSGFQKIFLPASVSRHRYCDDIIPLLKKFAEARLKLDGDDFSSKILLQVVLCCQGEDIEKSTLSFVHKKSFEWKLSFDPSSALKAFSWKYSRDIHNILCLVYAICFFKKISPNFIDTNYLSDVATTFQMPETFPDNDKKRIAFNFVSSISDEDYLALINMLHYYLNNFVKDNKSNSELIQFIKTVTEQKRYQEK